MKIYRDNFKLEGVYIYDTPSRKFWRGDVAAENGTITYLRFLPADEDCRGCGEKRRVIPAPVDVHTHGRNGVDFAGASAADMLCVIEDYAAVGTLVLMPTVASAPLDVMLESVKNIRAAGYDGAHIEGRWLNVKRKGAHNPALLFPPSTDELERFIAAADGMKLHITLAPELEGGEAFIRAAVRAKITVAAGHTDMTAEQAYRVLELGVTAFTHTFNAMPPLHHREPGAVAAALNSDAYTELICDGVHLHPEDGEARVKNKIARQGRADNRFDGRGGLPGRRIFDRGRACHCYGWPGADRRRGDSREHAGALRRNAKLHKIRRGKPCRRSRRGDDQPGPYGRVGR